MPVAKAGDDDYRFCSVCEFKKNESGEPPSRLVALPNRTLKKKTIVKICLDCDPHLVGLVAT